MKKQFIRYASAGLLGICMVMGGATIGRAANSVIAGAMATSAKIAIGDRSGTPDLRSVVSRDDYFRRPNPYAAPEDPGYYESSKDVGHQSRYYRNRNYRHRHYRHRGGGSGIYFNFGGRGGGFSFGVTPRRYYRPAPRYYGYPQVQSSAHIRWCYSRYRSYRQWDNTFQPYHGSRRQCISPYY